MVSGVKYGLGAISGTVEELDQVLDKEYFDLLSGLGVNRNIAKAWRTLPTCFLGMIGLTDLTLETTVARINTFLQHFKSDGCIGTALSASIEYLQLEIGTTHGII